MPIEKVKWREIRMAYAESREPFGLQLRVERAWAQTPDGRWVVLPGATDSTVPGRWWLGFDEREVLRRHAVGAILLCRSEDGSLLDFGLPVEVLHEIAPKLACKGGSHHREFNVVRRGDRYELLMREGQTLDITHRLGDVSWLSVGKHQRAQGAREPLAGYQEASNARPSHDTSQSSPTEHRFFARWVDGALEPIDPPELEDGASYLVIAVPAPRVPRRAAERRILAAAKRVGLPEDLADQHDHYAHGAPRR